MVSLLVAAALAADPVVIPGSAAEIGVSGDATEAVDQAFAALRAGRPEVAAQAFAALAEAGGGAPYRTWEALAWFSAGELPRAEAAAALAPRGPQTDALAGLVLAERGRGTDALAALGRAMAAAGTDEALKGRIELARAWIELDRGDLGKATAAADRAEGKASATELQAVRAEIGRLGGGAASDALGRVDEALGRGDLAAAKAAAPEGGSGARERIRASLATASIARAEGRFAEARALLGEAAAEAQKHGLVREQAAALGQRGVVSGAENRWEVARAELDQAVQLVSGTSFRVLERSLRTEAARAAAKVGALGAAKQELAAARALALSDAAGAALLDEVQGLVAAQGGETAAARASYDKAMAAHLARGAPLDAARVGALLVEATAADPTAAPSAKKRALDAFAAAGDPLGPAHVGVATGLGLAAAGQVDTAMRTFAEAARAAEAVGGTRGEAVARVARENAAKNLAELTNDAEIAELAKSWDLEALVARHQAYARARGAYDRGLAAYDDGRWDDAATSFDAAVRDLEAIGEAGYGAVARRSRAWARFNAAATKTAAVGLPIWQSLVEEGTLLRDAELRVRAMGAVALAASELGRPEALRSLRAAAKEAEGMGIPTLSAQCWSALAEAEPVLADKVSAARKAFALDPTERAGAYALYVAAVAAYEAESYALAIGLAEQALPFAGSIAPSVREVLDAARASSG